jgi:O-antigen/teichoic acid export membrane protein
VPLVARIGLRLPRPHVAWATVHYGWRVAIGQLFRFFSGRFDILVLSFLAPLATVGYYAVAQTVAEIVLIVPQSFGWVVLPMVAAGEAYRAAPALRLVGTLGVLGVLIVAILGPALILLGFGTDFRPALTPFFILLPGIWMLGMANICGSVLSGKKRPGTGSVLAGGAALATLVLDLALIPPFGIVGAAIAASAAYTFYGAWSLVLVSRSLDTPAHALLFVTRDEARGYLKAAATRLAMLRHE